MARNMNWALDPRQPRRNTAAPAAQAPAKAKSNKPAKAEKE